jgi:hypothetical protein
MKQLTSRWIPVNENPKALIFICHGYAMECSITMNSTARRLVKAGYAVYGIDYEGHGKSDGLPGLVLDFDCVIDDCFQHFSNICGQHLLSLFFQFHILIHCLPLKSTFLCLLFNLHDVAHLSFFFATIKCLVGLDKKNVR